MIKSFLYRSTHNSERRVITEAQLISSPPTVIVYRGYRQTLLLVGEINLKVCTIIILAYIFYRLIYNLCQEYFCEIVPVMPVIR